MSSKKKAANLRLFPTSIGEIREKINTNDDKKIEEFVTYCSTLLGAEEDRKKTIESKATTLTGISGLASSVIFGFGGFIFGKIRGFDKVTLLLVIILYLAFVLFGKIDLFLNKGAQASGIYISRC